MKTLIGYVSMLCFAGLLALIAYGDNQPALVMSLGGKYKVLAGLLLIVGVCGLIANTPKR